MRTLLLLCALTAAGLGSAGEASDESMWPTPFTAEQIRDAWTEGFWLETRTTTQAGPTVSRTEVTGWSAERGELRATQPGGEPVAMTVAWSDLRDHAVFARSNTTRSRDTRDTPLGRFEGWVFRIDGGEDKWTELFFADALPGPPVVYAQWDGETRVMLAEQIGRRGFETR
ncbi:hypothetical protein ABI59_19040 [Acidobacteria bacterium Mor1]|nr:hypothetical protein ABI59_19040 [Acidobacteria bacterium Mor1]